jgi:hypothetical protein
MYDSPCPHPHPFSDSSPPLPSQLEKEKLCVYVHSLIYNLVSHTENDDSAFRSKYVWPLAVLTLKRQSSEILIPFFDIYG